MVSQVAKELERKAKKKRASQWLSERHKPLPVSKSSSSGRPISAPIVEDEQTDYVNEGEDVEEDEIYENTEPEEIYLNTASRDDIYQNTPDITQTNIDSKEAYMNISVKQQPLTRAKLPKATPRVAEGKQYINSAAERVQDYAYSDSDHYLKLQPDEPEEVYEPFKEVYVPHDINEQINKQQLSEPDITRSSPGNIISAKTPKVYKKLRKYLML